MNQRTKWGNIPIRTIAMAIFAVFCIGSMLGVIISITAHAEQEDYYPEAFLDAVADADLSELTESDLYGLRVTVYEYDGDEYTITLNENNFSISKLFADVTYAFIALDLSDDMFDSNYAEKSLHINIDYTNNIYFTVYSSLELSYLNSEGEDIYDYYYSNDVYYPCSEDSEIITEGNYRYVNTADGAYIISYSFADNETYGSDTFAIPAAFSDGAHEVVGICSDAFWRLDNYYVDVEKIVIPEGVTTLFDRAFSYISLPVELPASLEYMTGDSFYGCNNELIFAQGSSFECEADIDTGFPSVIYKKLSDGKYELIYHDGTGTVTVKEGTVSIASGAFKAADSIILPTSLENISDDFLNLDNLASITVDDENPIFFDDNGVLYKKLENGSYRLVCYPWNKQAEEYTILDGTSTTEMYAFGEISGYSGEGTNGYSQENDYLKTLNIPESLETINIPYYSDVWEFGGPGLFGLCLEAINVDDANTVYCNGGDGTDGVLYKKLDGGKLELVRYPRSKAGDSYTVLSNTEEIGIGAFSHCDLKEIVLPEGVTVLNDYSLENCYDLETMVIPSTVNTIYDDLSYYYDDYYYINTVEPVFLVHRNSPAHLIFDEWGWLCGTEYQLVPDSDVISLTFNVKSGGRIGGTASTVALTSATGADIAVNVPYSADGGTASVSAAKGITYILTVTKPGHTAYINNSFAAGTDTLPERITLYAGDINADNAINAKDHAALTALFGKTSTDDEYTVNADFNEDGYINAKDRADIVANFGKSGTVVD